MLKFKKISIEDYPIINSYYRRVGTDIQYDMSFLWILAINGYYYAIDNGVLIVVKNKKYFGKTKEYLLHKPIGKNGYDDDYYKYLTENYGVDCRIISDNPPKGKKLVTGNKTFGGDIVYRYTKDDLKLQGKKWAKYRKNINKVNRYNVEVKFYEISDKTIPIFDIKKMIDRYKLLNENVSFHLYSYLKYYGKQIDGYIQTVYVDNELIGFSVCEIITDNYAISLDGKHIFKTIDNNIDFNMFIQYNDFKNLIEKNNIEEIYLNIGSIGDKKSLYKPKMKLLNATQRHVYLDENETKKSLIL